MTVSDTYFFGEYEINTARREVLRQNQVVNVQRKVFDLLVYLICNRDRAVDKDELQDSVWPGVIVTETALTRAVMKARRAVGDDASAQQVIRTVHGHGYRFVAELSQEVGAAASGSFDDLLKHTLAPQFELKRILGEGTMATVYLAQDTSLSREVAIKVLRPQLASEKIARQRFEREARATARMQHPNVVSVYGVGEVAERSSYMVMQYVDGPTLAEALEADGPLQTDDARSLLAQMSAGLAAAHAEGIIHRDLRPDNVLLAPASDGIAALLSDFGIAALAEAGTEAITRLTQLGESIGDLTYMSPEQLLGKPLDAQADIYSLGIVAYEMLSGQSPYRLEGLSDPAVAHLRQPARSLSMLSPDIPEDMAQLLLHCLAKTPEARPQAADVQNVLLGRGSWSPGERRKPQGGLLDRLKQRIPGRGAD